MTESARTIRPFRVPTGIAGCPGPRRPVAARGGARRLAQTLAVTLLGTTLLAGPAFAQDETAEMKPTVEVSEAYKKAMRAYLESQGAHAQIGQGIAYQVANETLMMIASSGAEVTEEMQTIVLEEALSTYEKKFSDLDFLTTLWAPVYASHFSVDELNAMTKWFESDLGRKVVSLSQTLNQEGMTEIQKASVSMAPEFQLAVDARFREAGLVSDAPAEP